MFPYTGLSITYIPVYSNFSSKIFSLCEVEFIQASTAFSGVGLPAKFSPAIL